MESPKITGEKLRELTQQFRGRPFAALIWEHMGRLDADQSKAVTQGLIEELPEAYHDALDGFMVFLAHIPNAEMKRMFTNDCGEEYERLMKASLGYFMKQHDIELSPDQAFTVFNIIVQYYVYACHTTIELKRMVAKAYGSVRRGRIWMAVIIAVIAYWVFMD